MIIILFNNLSSTQAASCLILDKMCFGSGLPRTTRVRPILVFQTRFLFANKMRLIQIMVSCREVLTEKVHKINKEATLPPWAQNNYHLESRLLCFLSLKNKTTSFCVKKGSGSRVWIHHKILGTQGHSAYGNIVVSIFTLDILQSFNLADL